MLTLAADGSLRVERGLVRTQDEPRPEPVVPVADGGEADTVDSGDGAGSDSGDAPVGDAAGGAWLLPVRGAVGATVTEPEDKAPALSAALLGELEAHRTAGLQAKLARQPELALRVLLHALATGAFYAAMLTPWPGSPADGVSVRRAASQPIPRKDLPAFLKHVSSYVSPPLRKGGGMRILALVSQKGGVGKTTLAGHLAVEAESCGDGPVALIDTDPQGSLAAWWNGRKAETPLFVKATIDELAQQIEALRRHGIALVVVDTPPAITGSISVVVEVADLVLIPTRPSPHDLRAVGATVDLVEKSRRPMVFVVNGATPRARITADAAVALSQHGTVAPATVHQRVDFASSMIDGRTVREISPESNSAREITKLWTYVSKRLSKTKEDEHYEQPKRLPA